MATIRDNEFILNLQNIFPTVKNIKLDIQEHSITGGQPWEGINRIILNDGKAIINVRAGRKGKDSTANWFKSKITGGCAKACDSNESNPQNLNFAFLGKLTITLTNNNTFTISDIIIAQGHNAKNRNNWWIGSKNMNQQGNLYGSNLFNINIDPKINSVNEFNVNQIFPNWMAHLDGSLRLSQLSIPGTHDSGTQKATTAFGARCQNFSIVDQLVDGIRFLDIRLRDVSKGNDSLNIYHGIADCELSFSSVLSQCTEFLSSNQGETILMSVKAEENKNNITERFFKDYFTQENFNKFIYKKNTIPSLNDARGKIIFFFRFDIDNAVLNSLKLKENEIGIKFPGFRDNNITDFVNSQNQSFYIQDKYQEHDTHLKSQLVKNTIEKAMNTDFTKKDIFFVNFNSIAYKIFPARTPYQYAWGGNSVDPAMNIFLSEYLSSISNNKTTLGTILLDFYNNENGNKNNSIVSKIINTNR